MNYLAHSFLSGPDEQLLVGNFIADSVRGNQLHHFPQRVAAGILLHRQIDTFTDTHPVVQQSKARLRPKYHKFAGVITDVFYDHFLAVNFDQYAAVNLMAYSEQVYALIQRHDYLLPERVKYFLPYMQNQNWLLNYAHLEGIRKSLTGLSRRTSFISGMETAADALQADYELYEAEFLIFFPELQNFVNSKLNISYK